MGASPLRPNTMKAKLLAGEPAVGCGLIFPSTHLVEILGQVGYDWVFLDCEHGSLTPESVEAMVTASEAAGIIPIVRPPTNAPHEILRVLDRGAMGVQVPHVTTAEDARAVVAAVKYMSAGHRGLGSPRSTGYGLVPDRQAYVDWANRELLVCVQIEDLEALVNLDEILAVEGVDVFFVGAVDLSQALGHPGDVGHAEVKPVIDATYARILAAGRIGGGSGSEAGLAAYRAQGITYLYTAVPSLLATASRALLAKLRAPTAG